MASGRSSPKNLSDEEQLLRLFVHGIKDYAVLILDTTGHVVSWNAGAEKIKGYRAEEVIGKHFSCFYPPEDVLAGKPQLALEAAAAYGHFEDMGRRSRKDGSSYVANVVITPIRDALGVLRGFGKITRDITDKVTVEDRLRVSESRLKSLVDTLLDGVITIDERGHVLSYNKACIRLFGYAPEEVIGRNVKMLMPEPYQSAHDGYIDNYKRTGVPKIIGTGREVSGRRKDGSVFPMDLAVSEMSHGGEHAFVGIVRDITERREAEKAREQLRHAQKMEAIGHLTGGIAHDFNNLLAIILGNQDFLNERLPPDSPLRQFVLPSIEAAELGSELTQRLLAFGRKQTLMPKILSINELVRSFLNLASRTLGERIELVTSLEPGLWNVLVDPGLLTDALLNLSVNARDAMPQGGKLIFETRNVHLEAGALKGDDFLPGDYAMLAVSDTGNGMTPEVAEKAFDPFFTTKDIGKGSGLGLSMVYGFVKQSAGHILLYSEPGRGTSFKIYLPRSSGSSAAAEPISPAPSFPQKRERVVLVVEDNAEVLKLTSSMVESLGYATLQAASGDAALRILEARGDIDLLLTDVMLPGELNGPELARQAMALHPHLKVLFNSGYAEHAIFQSGLLEQGGHLLSKPFRKAQLAEKLHLILED